MAPPARMRSENDEFIQIEVRDFLRTGSQLL